MEDSPSIAGGMGLIPGWGTRIPHAEQHSHKRNKNQDKNNQPNKKNPTPHHCFIIKRHVEGSLKTDCKGSKMYCQLFKKKSCYFN